MLICSNGINQTVLAAQEYILSVLTMTVMSSQYVDKEDNTLTDFSYERTKLLQNVLLYCVVSK